MKVRNKTTQESFEFDPSQQVGVSTKSIYIRKGLQNGTLFLSQRGNGDGGAGDICRIDAESISVNEMLYDRLFIFSQKKNKNAPH